MGGEMLKRLKIKKFKALKDPGDLHIKPITFFVGPNSSGKSSAIQILLALKQTVKSTDENTPLILQDHVDLGSYEDIIWNHNQKEELEVEFDVESKDADDKTLMCYKISYKMGEKGFNAGKIFLNKYSYIESSLNEKDKNNIFLSVKWLRKNIYSLTVNDPDSSTNINTSVYRKKISQFYPVKLFSEKQNIQRTKMKKYLDIMMMCSAANHNLETFF